MFPSSYSYLKYHNSQKKPIYRERDWGIFDRAAYLMRCYLAMKTDLKREKAIKGVILVREDRGTNKEIFKVKRSREIAFGLPLNLAWEIAGKESGELR